MSFYYKNRVAVVTGASGGIGIAIIKDLVRAGMKVVGFARHVEKINIIRRDLIGSTGELYALQCDLTKEYDILRSFQWVKDHLGGVDVLINNAGIAKAGFLVEPMNTVDILFGLIKMYDLPSGNSTKTTDWQEIIDTNLIALCICTREAIRSMRERNIEDGHIVHMNSYCGQTVPSLKKPTLNVYPATKHAITALIEGLRQELNHQQSKIRISCVSPGMVDTDHFQGLINHKQISSLLYPEDVSQSVMYVLNTPLHAHIQELIIRPVGEDL